MKFCFFSSRSKSRNEATKGRLVDILAKLGYKNIEIDLQKDCSSMINTIERSSNSTLSTVKYDALIIYPSDKTEECISHGIADYYSLKNFFNKENNFVLVIEDFFNHVARNEDIIFTPEACKIQLRATHIDSSLMEQILKTIIAPPVIYISYGNDKEGETRKLIKKIEQNAKRLMPYLHIEYDNKKLELGDDVSIFMDELTQSTRIIVILNQKYLHSKYGMNELKKIIDHVDNNNNSLSERIFLLTMKDVSEDVRSKTKLEKVQRDWEKKIGSLTDEKERQEAREFILLLNKIPDRVGVLYTMPMDTLEEENFIPLLWKIHQRLGKEGYITPYKNPKEMETHLVNK